MLIFRGQSCARGYGAGRIESPVRQVVGPEAVITRPESIARRPCQRPEFLRPLKRVWRRGCASIHYPENPRGAHIQNCLSLAEREQAVAVGFIPCHYPQVLEVVLLEELGF